MAADEIEWNIEVCESTFAELNKFWVQLKKLRLHLEELEHGNVLYLSGATGDRNRAVEQINSAIRGLSGYLNIQEAYLKRIKEPFTAVSNTSINLPDTLFNAQKVGEIPPEKAVAKNSVSTIAPLVLYFPKHEFIPANDKLWINSVTFIGGRASVNTSKYSDQYLYPEDLFINRINYLGTRK